MTWPKVEEAYIYHIKISDKKGKVIFEDQTTLLNYLWRTKKKATYYFQYAYADKDGNKSEYSNKSKILLQKKYLVDLEVDIERPASKQIFKVKPGKDTVRVNFRWEKIKDSTHYFVGIYNEKKKIILKNKTDLNRFYTFLPEGKYYWKVLAVYPESEKSSSKLYSFTIKNPYKSKIEKKEIEERILKEKLDYTFSFSAFAGMSSLAISFEYDDNISYTDLNIHGISSFGLLTEYRRGSTLVQLGFDSSTNSSTYSQSSGYLNILPFLINFNRGRIGLGLGSNFGNVSFIIDEDEIEDNEDESDSQISTNYTIFYLNGNLEYAFKRNLVLNSNLGVGALFDSSKFSLNYSLRNRLRHFWSHDSQWFVEYGLGVINHTIRNQSIYLFTNRYEFGLTLGKLF